MSDIYSGKKLTALKKLLHLVGNKKSRLAFELKVHKQTVQMWFMRGQISKDGALAVASHDELSKLISKEELRPDIWKS